MDVIKIYDDIPKLNNLVCAIGQFDGLHVAHLKLIEETLRIGKEKNLKTGLITFDPHPDFILNKQNTKTYLTPLENKIKIIESLGLDYLIIINFTMEVASVEPRIFVEKYLTTLGVKEVVVGFDFKFGKFGKGRPADIFEYSNKCINVTVIDEIKFHDEKIGTTQIKELLSVGKVDIVKELLGRYYSISSKVIKGSQIGSKIGVPTANLLIKDDFFDVLSGVYSVIVKVNNHNYLGVCNIGHNPSFNYQANKRLEIHIIDFNEDIYEEVVEVSFIKYLRSETVFNDINLFKEQINKDIKTTLSYKNLIE